MKRREKERKKREKIIKNYINIFKTKRFGDLVEFRLLVLRTFFLHKKSFVLKDE